MDSKINSILSVITKFLIHKTSKINSNGSFKVFLEMFLLKYLYK